ncbi:MAG TPA: extracellular solute-binding protein [Epulopiscium sp.]|nr:extracellular solute-binding protein [Candidatus Epulonipiscium sp.]
MKKMVTKLMSFLLVGVMITGCSGGSKVETPKEEAAPQGEVVAPPAPEGATEFELWTFQEIHTQYYDKVMLKWNEQNPDRQVALKYSVLPYDDLHNKLLIALQSGVGAPDIVDIEISKFPNYLKGEPQLIPLNSIIEPELDNIVKSRVDIYSKEGQYYGICFHVGASVMYYNQEILDAAGVNADDIVTWDDFRKAGKQVLEKTGVPMTTVESSDPWSIYPMLISRGADFLGADGEPTLDTPELKDTITFLQDMIKEGTAVVTPGGFHHAEEYYGFMNEGGAAAVSMPLWYMGRFTDYMTDLDGKMAIKPNPVWEKGQPRSVGLGGTGTSITNQCKDQELAKEVLAFAKLEREGNIEIWNTLGFDPIRTEVWSSEELKKPNKFTDFFVTNPFDVLEDIKDEIVGINVSENLPVVTDALRTTTFFRAFENLEEAGQVLKEEQALVKQN